MREREELEELETSPGVWKGVGSRWSVLAGASVEWIDVHHQHLVLDFHTEHTFPTAHSFNSVTSTLVVKRFVCVVCWLKRNPSSNMPPLSKLGLFDKAAHGGMKDGTAIAYSIIRSRTRITNKFFSGIGILKMFFFYHLVWWNSISSWFNLFCRKRLADGCGQVQELVHYIRLLYVSNMEQSISVLGQESIPCPVVQFLLFLWWAQGSFRFSLLLLLLRDCFSLYTLFLFY